MFEQSFLSVFQNYYITYILKLGEKAGSQQLRAHFWWQDERYALSDILKTIFGKENMLLAHLLLYDSGVRLLRTCSADWQRRERSILCLAMLYLSREILLEAEPLCLERQKCREPARFGRRQVTACRDGPTAMHCPVWDVPRMRADGTWANSGITGLEGKGKLGGVWCHLAPAYLFVCPSPANLSVPCGNHSWLPTNTGGRQHKCLSFSFFLFWLASVVQ